MIIAGNSATQVQIPRREKKQMSAIMREVAEGARGMKL
jgi:hypothetical protein